MSDIGDSTAASLLDATPDAILLVDRAGRITFANDRVKELFGYDPDELVGTAVEQLVPEGLREEHRNHRETFMEDPEQRPMGVGLDLRARRADGSTFPVDISLKPIERPSGVEVLAAVRDVTEQREHQRQVSRLRKATSRLMDADTDEEVAQLVATAATDLFGYESCVSRLVDDERHLRPVAVAGGDAVGFDERPTYPVDADTPVARVYRNGEAEMYDDVRTLEDGYDRGNARAAMYIPIGEYGVLSMLGTDVGAFEQPDLDLAVNLTANAETILDRIQNERELERQIERLDEFIDILSHDLQNPLNAAQLQLDIAGETTDSESLRAAQTSLDRMEDIIDYTLTLAQQGDDIGETTPVAVADLARQCWAQIGQADAQLDVDTTLTVRADSDRLQHVFENLFQNAVEHAGPDVTVSVGDLADGTGFYVADDGPGIQADEYGQIFEKGYTSTTDGTGFGLAIVTEIVDAHGWDIRVTDSTTGGARFEIRTTSDT